MELLQEAYWDEELRERVRHSLGLDRPFIVQYGEFLGRLMQGQLGYSILSGQRSINVMLAKAWPKSIQLGLVGMFFWFVSGTVLGIIAARSPPGDPAPECHAPSCPRWPVPAPQVSFAA